ncbi:MAG TPA: hypothetical protein VN888_00460 [Mycobacterium sp.]|nr:hypothetical protein [Mycobacterium sp.]
MRQTTFIPEFAEYIPRQLDDGVLYVSIQYCTRRPSRLVTLGGYQA